MSRYSFLILGVMLSICGLFGCEREANNLSGQRVAKAENEVVSSSSPHYVGSDACAKCHQAQYQLWSRSHHAQAMQVATPENMLGDFDGSTFEYAGTQSRFFKKGRQFFVRTDGPDGEIADFRVSHTFGVHPLQQLLVELPAGRKQALAIAWDSRSETEGGQHWFHLYPGDAIDHKDPLHWTGRNLNWNYMCADCHSTDLHKNFNSEQDQYATSWSEVNVGCEACHGPASSHISWVANEGTGESDAYYGLKTSLQAETAQLNSCAHCHSRRQQIAEGQTPDQDFLDFFIPAFLDEGLYHADGQILDEVFVFGSFLQSKMYRQGVKCTDCHDPHNAELWVSGNKTCTRCHNAQPTEQFPTLRPVNYDSPDHHFHSDDSQCISCHMPAKTYMVVDERRDHSFRIPRPDLTVRHGIPNTCNSCHADREAQWAAERIQEWYRHEPPKHFASAIEGGRDGQPSSELPVARLAVDKTQSGIVRATAMTLLAQHRRPVSEDALIVGLRDGDPLVRLGALRGSERFDLENRWRHANHLLADPVRAVRIEAGQLLAPWLTHSLDPHKRTRLQRAVDEYVAMQELHADRPEAHTNLGTLYAQLGDFDRSRQAYGRALDLDLTWIPALLNLADLNRAQGRDDAAGTFLREALEAAPDNSDVHYAFGLWLVRHGRSQEAIGYFRRSAELAPAIARFAYAYGVALNSNGDSDQALEFLIRAHARFPEDVDVLFALATISRDNGDRQAALAYAEKLLALWPENESFRRLADSL